MIVILNYCIVVKIISIRHDFQMLETTWWGFALFPWMCKIHAHDKILYSATYVNCVKRKNYNKCCSITSLIIVIEGLWIVVVLKTNQNNCCHFIALQITMLYIFCIKIYDLVKNIRRIISLSRKRWQEITTFDNQYVLGITFLLIMHV